MCPNASAPDRRRRSQVLVAAALLASALPALALQADRTLPMQIKSDNLAAGMDNSTTVLTGNVQIIQGSLVVKAARADITQDKGEVSRAVLTGAPATLKQSMDTGGELNASAKTIDYKLADEAVELRGGVVLERPQGTLRSERVVYSVKTGQLAAGEGVSGGVELIIPPRPAKAETPAEAPKSGAVLPQPDAAPAPTGP